MTACAAIGLVTSSGCQSYPPASLNGSTDEYPCFPDCVNTFTQSQCTDEAHAQGCTGVLVADEFTCPTPTTRCNVFCWSKDPGFNCDALITDGGSE